MPVPRLRRRSGRQAVPRRYHTTVSHLPEYPGDMGYGGLRMTADEYLALGETQTRYELIHGVVVMHPSTTPAESEFKGDLLFELSRSKPKGAHVYSRTDLRVSDSTVYCPDAACYGPGRFDRTPERLDVPPNLVIEIVSAWSRALDLITKRDDYEAFGVREYWAVDPERSEIRRWERRGTRLCETPTDADPLISTAIPGLSVGRRAFRSLIPSEPQSTRLH
jgi:Uma2 family endonuclease